MKDRERNARADANVFLFSFCFTKMRMIYSTIDQNPKLN